MVVRDEDDLPEEVGRVILQLAEEYALDPCQEILDRQQALQRFPLPKRRRWHAEWWACSMCGSTLHFQEYKDNLSAWKAKNTVERVSEAVAGGDLAVRTAIVAELLPWALGYGDPVRERVEARQRGKTDRDG